MGSIVDFMIRCAFDQQWIIGLLISIVKMYCQILKNGSQIVNRKALFCSLMYLVRITGDNEP